MDNPRTFDCELASNENGDVLHADSSEVDTIELMASNISQLPEVSNEQLRNSLLAPTSVSRLRNFASFVAREETFTMEYGVHTDSRDAVAQKVLCVDKRAGEGNQSVKGSWSAFFNQR